MSADGPDEPNGMRSPVQSGDRRRFTRKDSNNLAISPMRWRVKGLWPDTGVCVVAGPSMSGKSFWLLDALASLCRGDPVMGLKSKPAGVVYVGAEDAAGIDLRIRGLQQEFGKLPKALFQVIGEAPDLGNASDVDELRDELLRAKAEMEGEGFTLGIVAIDTMSAAMPGVDENSAKDMSPVLHRLHALARELGIVVVLVAHTGKEHSKGIRGWSGTFANADGVVMIDGPHNDGVRTAKATKVKNGQSDRASCFKLRVVQVGVDEDGDGITTCVVEQGSAMPRTPSSILPAKAIKVLEVIDRMVTSESAQVAGDVLGLPDGTRGIERDRLLDELMELTSAQDMRKPSSIRKAHTRALEELDGHGQIHHDNGIVWRLRNAQHEWD